SGLADDAVNRLRDLPSDETTETGESLARQLADAGWRPPADIDGFGAGQPRYSFHVSLRDRSEDDVLRGFNQLWRRNIKKADKSGVVVSHGTAADLPTFHRLYTETAHRDGFHARPMSYFTGMWEAMTAEAPDRLRLYLAHHEGDLIAATTMVRVGAHAWYSYGASSTEKREFRGSNAVQWQMIQDALADGCDIYDLRGITDTLDESDPHAGLIRFKLGTGGHAVEYLGEWDLPISRILYSAFDMYMKRRS
ncbi:lipid II:glycine glycyltransferase FemX, partial [Phytoactinopolyspora endophytica]|uniref:lipid II:glycine glycyltransferase FemX n=1 Tax=Phytoactinopolyspora endophytica TaxID=1642495 RepID=UPI001F0EEF22